MGQRWQLTVIQKGYIKLRGATVWLVPDSVLNFTHLIGKLEFGHRRLADVIEFNVHCCSITVFRRTDKKFRI